MAEVKSLGAEEHRAQEAIRVSDVREGRSASKRSGVVRSQAVMLLTSLISVALLYLVGRDIVLRAFTLGGYLAFSGYISKLLAPFSNVMSYSSWFSLLLRPWSDYEFVDEVTEEKVSEPVAGDRRRNQVRNVDLHPE